jgi:16S rRNA (adenine1518-N6/adenine1519-N6)-dimethyltransferase
MPLLTHRPRKSLGQHFLRNPRIIQRILESVQPTPAQHLVEIGPGLGAITRPLAEQAGCLDVVELDPDIIPHLRGLCAGAGEVRIHNTDALVFDFAQLHQEEPPLRIIGNLPYYISTPLLFHLLKFIAHIDDMHFMLQKEVVERMAAGPNQAAYGRLSVMLQYRCGVEPLFNVNPRAFTPSPKVESTFVRLIPHDHPPARVVDEARFAGLVRQAFSQRRKTLRNSLRPMLDEQEIMAAGIDPGMRAENLGIAEFAVLSNRLV